MGSYATLKYGAFSVGEFKSRVPLEPLLLFTQQDYKEGTEVHEEEEYSTHRFVTTASLAKQRVDARGLTIAACRRIFEEFRVERFYNYSAKTGREWFTPNTATFDDFLEACQVVMQKCDSWYLLEHSKTRLNKKIKRMFSDEFFGGDIEDYFQDALFAIVMRSFLEVTPDKHDIVLDFSDLVHGEYLNIEQAGELYSSFQERMLYRLSLNYLLYGFVIEHDPNVDARLRERLDGFDENQFIDHVLMPLLNRMGFQRIRKVTFHGRNEFGTDILPFRYTTPLGTLEYYAVQAKAVPIHGTSARDGNAGELISQTTQAFKVAFVDDLDNERKHIDKFIVATSKSVTPDARHVIESAVEGERRVVFLDIDRIVALVKEHRLVQYLLFTPLT